MPPASSACEPAVRFARRARGLGEICGTPITAMRLRGVMHRHALHGVERHGFPVEMDIGPMHRFRVAPVIGEDMHRRRVVILKLNRRRLDEGELPLLLPSGRLISTLIPPANGVAISSPKSVITEMRSFITYAP